MAVAEYLDGARSPFTTRVTNCLSARAQIQIDSLNLGVMCDGIADGRILTQEESARYWELEAKAAYFAEVWA
jgi:phosphopantetheinyl transferase (holo-ACP synthase)